MVYNIVIIFLELQVLFKNIIMQYNQILKWCIYLYIITNTMHTIGVNKIRLIKTT